MIGRPKEACDTVEYSHRLGVTSVEAHRYPSALEPRPTTEEEGGVRGVSSSALCRGTRHGETRRDDWSKAIGLAARSITDVFGARRVHGCEALKVQFGIKNYYAVAWLGQCGTRWPVFFSPPTWVPRPLSRVPGRGVRGNERWQRISNLEPGALGLARRVDSPGLARS